MEFNFDWNYVSAGAPYITISSLSLSFNSAASALLGNPEKVVIGFDQDAMTIGIKRYDDTDTAKPFEFFGRMKNRWVRVGCKDFIKQLSSLTGISFSPAKRYVANYDHATGIMYISVTEEYTSLNEK